MKNVLVTPTYKPDLERCQLLVSSAERFVRGFDAHYLLVDRRDLKVFAPLAKGNVHLMCKEDLLPKWIFAAPGSRKWWMSLKTLPVRGWVLQQVVKLAVAEVIDADALIYADSDVLFVRDWSAHQLWQGDRLRLFREPRVDELLHGRRYKNWYRVAAHYSQLQSPDMIQGGYIAQLNAWRTGHVRALLADIERLSGKPWKQALLGTLDFSEFILYGTYVEHRLAGRGHFWDPKPLTLSSWYHPVRRPEDLPAFLSALEPHHVGIHIQSNLRFLVAEYRHLLATP